MSILNDLTKLAEARLRAAKAVYKKVDGGSTLSRQDLDRLEQLYSEVEEIHELIVVWIDKNKVPLSA